MNDHKTQHWKRLTGLIAVLLLCMLWTMAGCGSSTGYSRVDTSDQHALWISCDWAADADGQATVRRFLYDKESKSYVMVEEYAAVIGEDRNNIGIVVSHEGIYQLELSAEGYETQTRMVEVDDSRIYRISVHMPPLDTLPAETLPPETTLPVETIPPETTLPPETNTP